MDVTDSSPHSHRHDDRDFYFCSAGCRQKFAADPDYYLDPEARAAKIVAGVSQMHSRTVIAAGIVDFSSGWTSYQDWRKSMTVAHDSC